MSTTLAQLIQLVRSRHPAFQKQLVPDKSLADFFTTEQRRILTLALTRDKQFMAQTLPIAFDLTNASLDAPGTAGIGTQGGLPAVSDGQGGYSTVQATTGSAVTVDLDSAVTLVNDTPVLSATHNTLSATGVAWTVNVYANATVIITNGLGAGQTPRTVASNTSSQITTSDDWEIQPDVTSTFRVVQAGVALDGSFGVVTDLPSLTTSEGFLVRLNSSGQPYVDLTKPLVVSLSKGVPLPPFHAVLGGTVRYLPNSDFVGNAIPLSLESFARRDCPTRMPAAYLMGAALHLIGNRADWAQVQGIELWYVPIPPAFTTLADYLLLPDTAVQVLVARAALFAGSRLNGLPNAPQVDPNGLLAEAQLAEDSFLKTLTLTSRSRVIRMRPRGY